jgi:hypothetical protein
MVTFHADACDKCRRRSPVSFLVQPEEAWPAVVLNRWRKLCPPCFDTEAEKAGVRYSFVAVEAISWSDRPVPRSRGRRRR